jgi:hypothetical protein
MGYTVYDRSLYRTGFRPYRRTNTAAAASGMGSTPFAPEHLHGYPFTPRGGSHLHGLGSIVPDQSIVIYQGRWQTTYHTWSPMDVVRAVESALPGDGLTVRNEAVSAGTAAKMGLANIPFSVTLTIQVSNGMGYGDPNDILSIINHEVYAATGYMPLAGSITSVQVPGGSIAPTGQPEISSAPDPNCAAGMPYGVDGSACPGPPGSPQDLTTWLEGNVWWLALLAAGVFVLPRVL